MSRLVRPLSAVLIALVIAFTSGAMAVARGQAPAAGEMVICTGQGVVTLSVDADGNPTGPTHICPDCALSLFHATFESPSSPRPAPRLLILGRVPETLPARGFAPASPRARAPPRA